jgi:glycerophosphoryl diester phosphodiesterase
MSPLVKKILQTLISVERWPSQSLILPRMQAHRGYRGNGAVENSLQAFRDARAKGALMYECDVRLSRDGIPVLCHDEDIQRVSGQAGFVKEMTAKQLFERAGICSLEQALLDQACPRLANIEIKSDILIDDPLERKVSDVVKKCRAEKRVLFSSFNPMSILRLSWHLPDVPRALLVTEADEGKNNFILKNMLAAPLLQFHMLNLDFKMLTEERMDAFRRRRIPVSVWTVNGKDEIQKYLKMGVVSVITDSL